MGHFDKQARERLPKILDSCGCAHRDCPHKLAVLSAAPPACAREVVEPIRKITAEWDAKADEIDDGSGVTICAEMAAILRNHAKQIDVALGQAAGGKEKGEEPAR